MFSTFEYHYKAIYLDNGAIKIRNSTLDFTKYQNIYFIYSVSSILAA